MTIARGLDRRLLVGVVLVLVATGLAIWLRSPEQASGSGAPSSTGEPRRTTPWRGHDVAATIGVVSQNVHHYGSFADTRHDLERITRNPAVDLIGWQESAAVRPWKRPARAEFFQRLHPELRARGWETAYFPDSQGTRENAISWRSSEFRLVSSVAWRLHDGAPRSGDRLAFPPGGAASVLLEHVGSGLTVRLVNTHLSAHIETGQGFAEGLHVRYAKQQLAWLADRFTTLSGDVVVGTGDYNWDFRDDQEVRLRDGLIRQFAGAARSSYQVLGTTGVEPTHGSRWIDYIFLAADDLAAHRAQFATHRSLGGYRSDHRPLLARIRLYE